MIKGGVMDRFRVGRVWLLLLLVALTLPLLGLAGAQNATNPGNVTTSAPIENSTVNSTSSSSPAAEAQSETATAGANEAAPAAIEAQGFNATASGRPNATALEETKAPVEQDLTDQYSSASASSGSASESSIATSAPATVESVAATASTQNASIPEDVTSAVGQTQGVITPDVIPANSSANATSGASNNVTSSTPTIALANASSGAPANVSANVSANASINASANASAVAPATIPAAEEPETTEDAKESDTGDRIWRVGMPIPYTWTPQSFAGFFYDVDDGVGTETLTVKQLSGRTIDSNDLLYSTTAQPLKYKFENWGKYQVIGFMADKYFAGYEGTDIVDRSSSLINDGQLRKVLIDSDESRTITSGSVLPLEEGYELRIKEVDINGNKVFMEIAKDGDMVDQKVISPGSSVKDSTYQYKVDIGGEDTPIILAHMNNVFTSAESSLVTVDGLFQISDIYTSVDDGDKYGEMKLSVADNTIEAKNEDSISLRKGKVVPIFGNVSFTVADNDTIRFAPTVIRSGTYDVRGTVIDPSDPNLGGKFTWTPYNFEGFYYNIDDDIGSESLKAVFTGNRIEENDLTYEAMPVPVKFDFEDWGKYDVIGFLAAKYFAGYNSQTVYTDEHSIIGDGQLRKVLVDSDESSTISTGSVLPLEEGYELRIKQVDINGNKVYLALAKDGDEVDSMVVTPSSSDYKGSTYLYKVNIEGEDVPIIAAHVQSVFRGTEADLATADGVFQVSDTATSVNSDQAFDKMKVKSVDADGIMMKNDGSISLGRGRTVDIMENIRFEVADNDTNRMVAPIAEIVGSGKPLNLSIPAAEADEPVTITITSLGEVISGASVFVSGSSIGNTDATGTITYTPKTNGDYDVVARKAGYSDGKATLNVGTAAASVQNASLMISVPTDVTKGENFVISVTEGLSQNSVNGAEINFDGQSIGSTSIDGTLSYSTNITGEHTVQAAKERYQTASRSITVVSPITVMSISAPAKASTGSNVKINAIVTNSGTVSDYRNLTLLVNGMPAAYQNVTVVPGVNKTVSFSYKPKDVGTYRLSVDDKEATVVVEKSSFNWLLAVIFVLLIAIGAGYYLYSTGELENMRRRVQGR